LTTAYVGLGANRGEPEKQVRAAIAELATWGPLRASSLWRTEPLGGDSPDWYVNAVVELETGLEPQALLTRLREVEQAFGRPAERERFSPRTLDLDLLLHGDAVVRSSVLTLPHPGLTRRRFVLAPLAELAPELVPPGETRSVALLLAHLDDPLRVEKL
jgi:2-amino-4-hydroxy-6-hydroxymethyldihydropteridine diphosphokinase